MAKWPSLGTCKCAELRALPWCTCVSTQSCAYIVAVRKTEGSFDIVLFFSFLNRDSLHVLFKLLFEWVEFFFSLLQLERLVIFVGGTFHSFPHSFLVFSQCSVTVTHSNVFSKLQVDLLKCMYSETGLCLVLYKFVIFF